MPLKIDRSDRRLLLWAAAFLIPMIVALALAPDDEEDSGVPSTYSAQSRGAKAAFLLLREEGYSIQRWESPPAQLPPSAAGTMLVLAHPVDIPSPQDKQELHDYLTRGGKILLTGPQASWYLPLAQTKAEPASNPVWKEYHPQLVSALTRGGAIQMSPSAYWDNASTVYTAHYADDDGRPLVVTYKVGYGEVIWWSSSVPLSNAGISVSGNLALLLNSIGDRSQTVYWDEYFHGIRPSLMSYLAMRPVVFGFLQAGLIVLALLITYARRNGPIHPPEEPSRLSPLEFVETLGGLYRRAEHTRTALEVPYRHFREIATRQLGLTSDVTALDLARSLRSRLRLTNDDLKDLLQEIENALHDPDLSQTKALRLVQRLSPYTGSLRAYSHPRQENITHAHSAAGTHARTE